MASKNKFKIYDEAARVARLRSDTQTLANNWAEDAERIGTRIQRVREVVHTATSKWSRDYWSQVLSQLERQALYSQREFA